MKVQSHRHSICSILQYTGSNSTGSTGNNIHKGCIRSALSYISLYVQCMQIGTSIVQDSRTGTGITTTGLGALVEYGKDMKRVEVCIATCINANMWTVPNAPTSTIPLPLFNVNVWTVPNAPHSQYHYN